MIYDGSVYDNSHELCVLSCYLLDHLISVTWSEAASFSVGIQDVATPEENISGSSARTFAQITAPPTTTTTANAPPTTINAPPTTTTTSIPNIISAQPLDTKKPLSSSATYFLSMISEAPLL